MTGLTITDWPSGPKPQHHFEMTISTVDHPPEGPALLVTYCADPNLLATYFDSVTKLGNLRIPSGTNSSRDYMLFRLEGRRGPLKAMPLCGPPR